MIDVEYLGERAQLRDMQWYSSDPLLQRMLRRIQYDQLWPGYAPSREWAYALQVQERLDKLKILTGYPSADTQPGVVN